MVVVAGALAGVGENGVRVHDLLQFSLIRSRISGHGRSGGGHVGVISPLEGSVSPVDVSGCGIGPDAVCCIGILYCCHITSPLLLLAGSANRADSCLAGVVGLVDPRPCGRGSTRGCGRCGRFSCWLRCAMGAVLVNVLSFDAVSTTPLLACEKKGTLAYALFRR